MNRNSLFTLALLLLAGSSVHAEALAQSGGYAMPDSYAPSGRFGGDNYGGFVSQEEVDRLDRMDIEAVEPLGDGPATTSPPGFDDMTFSVGNSPWETLPSPFVPPPHLRGNPGIRPVPQRFISPHELYMLDNPRQPMGYGYGYPPQQNQVWGDLKRNDEAGSTIPMQQAPVQQAPMQQMPMQQAPMYQAPMYQPPTYGPPMLPYQAQNPYGAMMPPMTPYFPGAGSGFAPGGMTSPFMTPGLGMPGSPMMNSIAPFLY